VDFQTFSSRVLDDCLQLGARAAEVYFKTGGSTDIKLHQGKVSSVVSAEEEGVGIRFVLPGGRVGYVYTSDTAPESVAQVIQEGIRGAEEGEATDPPLTFPGVPGPLRTGEELGIFDPTLGKLPISAKVEMVRAMETAALNEDLRVLWVDTLIWHDGWTEVWLRNSAGFLGRFRKTLCHTVLSVLARDDDEAAILAYHSVAYPLLTALDPARVGAEAARRAAAPLEGRRLSPQQVTVVLEPHVAARVLEFLAPSLLADACQRGRSLFAGMRGAQVAAPCVTLVDDGALRSGVSTTPFDGEGTPTRRKLLVEKGVLRAVLHDRQSAAREPGAESTGNAVRTSFTEPPTLGVTNLCIEPGTRPVAEILPDIPAAFRVMNLMNVGGVNPVTGAFSVAASGVWIEHGEPAFPVAGVTLSGNLQEIARRIVAVGDDLEWEHGRGSYGAPTLVVEGLTVAG